LRSKRKFERFIRRLETEFTAGDRSFRGISSDFSTTGLFIRTMNPFTPGSIINITVHLPDGSESRLKGKVMRAMKAHLSGLKGGMGVALLEKDQHYIHFMKSFSPDIFEREGLGSDSAAEARPGAPAEATAYRPEFSIITCPACGVKNKVATAKLSLGPKCGKCGSLIIVNLP